LLFTPIDPDFQDQPGNENEEDLYFLIKLKKPADRSEDTTYKCRALVVILSDKFSETTMVYAAFSNDNFSFDEIFLTYPYGKDWLQSKDCLWRQLRLMFALMQWNYNFLLSKSLN